MGSLLAREAAQVGELPEECRFPFDQLEKDAVAVFHRAVERPIQQSLVGAVYSAVVHQIDHPLGDELYEVRPAP